MQKLIDLLTVPIVIFSLCVCGITFHSRLSHVLPYKDGYCEINFTLNRDELTYRDVQEDINKLFNCQYILIYRDLSDADIIGCAYIIPKIVVIHDDLSMEDFVITLTHELIHITHITTNERYTSFQTFKILYESDNDYFKNVALYFAHLQVKNYYSYDYDCSGYIVDYLKQPLS